ncbi:MAG: hypothetical protein WAT93_07430 [Pontixanthobacter sp.]
MIGRELHIGITGHREGNAAFDANKPQINDALMQLLDGLAALPDRSSDPQFCEMRIITCLAHGADLMAAGIARDRKWPVSAPLPFGKDLNMAINTPQMGNLEVLAALDGVQPQSEAASQNWKFLSELTEYAHCFALAEQDDPVRAAIKRREDAGAGLAAISVAELHDIGALLAERSHAASMIMLEQSDVLIAIWDGSTSNALGGTRDTINKALHLDIPVIWINPSDCSALKLLIDPADLVARQFDVARSVSGLIIAEVHERAQLRWDAVTQAESQFASSQWRNTSARRFHMYRRIEAMFGGGSGGFSSLVQTYERPDAIAEGGGKKLLEQLSTLPGSDASLVDRIAKRILPRFAFADGLSTYLSDAYRGGMVASFLLSAAAIVGGIAYLPFVSAEHKWPFALLEFVLLLAIVAITIAGTKGNWHRRWFRTRRVAEYLRHAPIMISLGCARALGRWPHSRDESWPEIASRMRILSLGLPQMVVTQAYLRNHLELVVRPFLQDQSSYHRAKAARLERVHHNLDRMSEVSFVLAVVSVGSYLLLKLLSVAAIIDPAVPLAVSKSLTFLGVALPTFGAALAGIRYFGDFERFAAISDITATKLERLELRAANLASGQEGHLVYRDYANLAHAMNDVVIEEIESWQSIFGTKKMAVPV